MDVNIHAIGDKDFSISIDGTGCPVITICVGAADVKIFFHDHKIDRALHDIDVAIRAFLDNRK